MDHSISDDWTSLPDQLDSSSSRSPTVPCAPKKREVTRPSIYAYRRLEGHKFTTPRCMHVELPLSAGSEEKSRHRRSACGTVERLLSPAVTEPAELRSSELLSPLLHDSLPFPLQQRCAAPAVSSQPISTTSGVLWAMRTPLRESDGPQEPPSPAPPRSALRHVAPEEDHDCMVDDMYQYLDQLEGLKISGDPSSSDKAGSAAAQARGLKGDRYCSSDDNDLFSPCRPPSGSAAVRQKERIADGDTAAVATSCALSASLLENSLTLSGDAELHEQLCCRIVDPDPTPGPRRALAKRKLLVSQSLGRRSFSGQEPVTSQPGERGELAFVPGTPLSLHVCKPLCPPLRSPLPPPPRGDAHSHELSPVDKERVLQSLCVSPKRGQPDHPVVPISCTPRRPTRPPAVCTPTKGSLRECRSNAVTCGHCDAAIASASASNEILSPMNCIRRAKRRCPNTPVDGLVASSSPCQRLFEASLRVASQTQRPSVSSSSLGKEQGPQRLLVGLAHLLPSEEMMGTPVCTSESSCDGSGPHRTSSSQNLLSLREPFRGESGFARAFAPRQQLGDAMVVDAPAARIPGTEWTAGSSALYTGSAISSTCLLSPPFVHSNATSRTVPHSA